MKARPILFSAVMVRALLDGHKTQTRRIVKPLTKRHPILNLAEHGVDVGKREYSGRFDDPKSWGFVGAEDGVDMALADWLVLCHYGQPGDLLWVRETFMHEPASYEWSASVSIPAVPAFTAYKADFPDAAHQEGSPPWKPSIHMPRNLSRLTLEITDVRVERVQDCSEADALAEGVTVPETPAPYRDACGELVLPHTRTAREAFRSLWHDTNGPGAWERNDWCWCLTFKVLRENVDTVLAHNEAAA